MESKTREFYFGTTPITEAKLEDLTKIYSDRSFLYGAHKMVLLLGKNGVSVYPGVFSYVGGESSGTFLFGVNEVLGISINPIKICIHPLFQSLFIDIPHRCESRRRHCVLVQWGH